MNNPTDLHITQLFLDSENPRHDVISNQKDIIKQLLDTEKIENLAKDITEQGSLSPLETVGVLPAENNSDEYIVVEGNRRVCACLLLNDPSLSPNNTIRQRFERLRKNNNIPSEVKCIVFSSRDEADHWIQLRHEGQQDGRGTKSWDAPQIARYAEKRGRKNPNLQAIKLIDYAVSTNLITPDEAKKISITTIQRYLNNPIFRNVFGLENKEDLQSKHDDKSFNSLTGRFIKDAQEGKDVNSRSKGKDWKAYANRLQSEITDPPPENNPVKDYEVPKKDAPKNNQNPQTQTQSKPDPTKRKNLIPYNVKFSISDKILNRVYIEMRKLEVEGHEFSSSYLIRAFVEGSIVLYMQKHLPDDLRKESKLHNKIDKVAIHLEKSGVKKGKIKPLKLASSDSNSILSPFMLGSMVHLSVIPTKRELINIWDRLENILLEIHNRI